MRELKDITERKGCSGRREYRIFCSFLRGAWIAAIALSMLVIPSPFLVLSNGKKKLLIPLTEGEKVFYSYIHSYANSLVEDCWILHMGGLYLAGERIEAGGAGNPAGDEGRFLFGKDGAMIFYAIGRELPNPIYIRVSGKYRNTIFVRGKAYNLSEIFGKDIRVKVGLIYMGW